MESEGWQKKAGIWDLKKGERNRWFSLVWCGIYSNGMGFR